MVMMMLMSWGRKDKGTHDDKKEVIVWLLLILKTCMLYLVVEEFSNKNSKNLTKKTLI